MAVEKEFYSVGEVAKILDLSQDRVYEYLRTGYIKGSRLTKNSAWRIHKGEVDRLRREKGSTQPEEQGRNPWEVMASLAQQAESRGLTIIGQAVASELDRLAPHFVRSFGCYDIELKHLHDTLSACLGQRFDTWIGGLLKDVESFLERRRTIQEQIPNDAKDGCESLGFVKLIDNNFALAAYHFLARGDETWLGDDRFQVVELGLVGPARRQLECPRCPYYISLQGWDTRGFTCPEHEVPLVQKEVVISPPLVLRKAPGLYEESVDPIEDIATEHLSKGALSLHMPKMLPFSEVVIAVGEMPSMPKLTRFAQDFLRTSSALREEVRGNEDGLQRSYAKLLQTLRSASAAGPE